MAPVQGQGAFMTETVGSQLPQHVHFLGVCGYAVSGAALLAKQIGCMVTGSDDCAYPPTTDILTGAGIPWVDGSDPVNLDRWGLPDLVVVGNQTRPGNPEWQAVRSRSIPYTSEIEFFAQLTQDRVRLSVCGTHGKTTTTALLAHMLAVAGLDPGLRLGSTSLDLGASARLGKGPFVFEGDEYTTAPWDPRPKFLHTRPQAACVTRLELDHPDIYASLDAYREPFVELAKSMPVDGLLAVCADDSEAVALAPSATCRVVTYGESPSAGWRISHLRDVAGVQHFHLNGEGAELEVALTFPGRHNAANACAALLLAAYAGASLPDCLLACTTFRGPARRFQILGEVGGCAVVDDYAHHPTECHAAIDAARQRYAGRRLIAVHTPHTYSRTLTLLDDYADVFEGADVLLLGPIEAARERGQEVTVTSEDVAARVRHVPQIQVVDTSQAAIDLIGEIVRDGDVVLVLSLGGFDKIASRIHAALRART